MKKILVLLCSFMMALTVYGQSMLEEKANALFKEYQVSQKALQELVEKGTSNGVDNESFRLASELQTRFATESLERIKQYTIRDIGIAVHVLDMLVLMISGDEELEKEFSENFIAILRSLKSPHLEFLEAQEKNYH